MFSGWQLEWRGGRGSKHHLEEAKREGVKEAEVRG